MTYTLKRSFRAKYMRLTVKPGGFLVVTMPTKASKRDLHSFLQRHARWIERSIVRMRSITALPVTGRRAYLEHKEAARTSITARVMYWNRFYAFSHGRIAIKNTKRIWGSCSQKGNLNFSFGVHFLPPELADYIVVHELCHLREHNHGRKFWDLVAQTLPDYIDRRTKLRSYLPT